MQRQIIQAINDTGNLESVIQANVYLKGTLVKASLYSDNGVTALAQPITSDVEGDFDFYVANGQYDLVTTAVSGFASKTTTFVANDLNQPGVIQLATSVSVVRIVGKSGLAVNTPADTTEDILATVTIPANSMGANGVIEVVALWSCTNNANAKTARVRFGGIGGTIYESVSLANFASANTYATITNQNATNSQVGYSAAGFGTSTSALVTSAIDTTVDQTIVFTGQKATAGDTLTLNSYLIRLFTDGK